MSYFLVNGGNKLSGKVKIPGAKNAVLPMMCAALLTSEKCVFRDVPNIGDVRTLLEIFQEIGVEVQHDTKTKVVEITARSFDPAKLATSKKIKKLRATLLLLGPVLARYGEVKIPMPGGCVIGARSNGIHIDGLTTLGAEIVPNEAYIHLRFKRDSLAEKRILLPEASVTGTENLAIFLAGQKEETEMYFTAAEPHVCTVLRMLQTMGADIEGIGTHKLRIRGNAALKGGDFTVSPDGLLVGTYAIAGAITGGDLMLENVNHEELFSFYGLLKRVGVNFEMGTNRLRVQPSSGFDSIPKLQTGIYPSFSTDLQSPFGVLLTQCQGTTRVFETLFENRLTYLNELEKMGAQIEMLNAHEARITGPTQLRGAEVTSWDLRAGAAMVLAGLIAEGTTKITNIAYIDRGYEDFVENLCELGGDIKRVEEEAQP